MTVRAVPDAAPGLSPAGEESAPTLGPEARLCPICGSPDVRSLFSTEFEGQRFALARCTECGLHFTTPRPAAAFLAAHYSGQYHADLRSEGGTERAFGAKYSRYAGWLTEHRPGGRFLDIGCSTGLLVRMMRDRGFLAEGLELNPESARWGREHYGIVIHDRPLEECGFAPGTFDAVAMTDVLEHTLHPLDYLRTVGPLLVPGGLALVTFPDIASVESRYLHLMAKLTGRPWVWANCHIPLHIWEFTRPTAAACFEKAGFSIVAFRRTDGPDDPDMPSVLKLLKVPLRPLAWPKLADRFGTQMEFLIARNS